MCVIKSELPLRDATKLTNPNEVIRPTPHSNSNSVLLYAILLHLTQWTAYPETNYATPSSPLSAVPACHVAVFPTPQEV